MTANNNDKIRAQSRIFHACALSQQELQRLARGTAQDRNKALEPIKNVSDTTILTVQPMHWYEQAACLLVLTFGVPNGAFTIPIATVMAAYLVGCTVAKAFLTVGVVLLPLALAPQPFVPSVLNSWIAVQLIKYFSFRVLVEEPQPDYTTEAEYTKNCKRPRLTAVCPHGVFPYGNVCSMLVWPSFTGHNINGLAASSALRVPIFKQMLRSIGVVDASRNTARKTLVNYPYSVGVSPGGVAEVFESSGTDEVLFLKARKGLIKLAIRTGSDLVPAYIFGTNQIMWCWYGQGVPGLREVIQQLSRRVLGFALVGIFGRWGLPIPQRQPLLTVLAPAISTQHMQCEEPTDEQVEQVQQQLIQAFHESFDRNKGLYGWQDKHLIIK